MGSLLIPSTRKSIKQDRSLDSDSMKYISKKGWVEWNSVYNIDFIYPKETPKKLFDFSAKVSYTKVELKVDTLLGSFTIDEKLDGIYKCINESKLLKNLQDDWDEEGAIGCNYAVYDRAVNLLLKYAQNVLKYYGAVIQAPDINLTKDGSVDLEWSNANGILLITVLNSLDFDAHYYGSDFKTGTIIKGALKNYTVNRNLSFWMQSLA